MTNKQTIWRKLGEALGVSQPKKHASKPVTDNQKGGPDMADKKMTENERKALVSGLIANRDECDACPGWKEEDRNVLMNLSDASLVRLVENRKQVKSQEAVVNALSGKFSGLTVNEMPEFIKEKIAAKKDEEEEDEEEECVDGKLPDGTPCGDKKKPAENRRKSDKDWLASLPAEAREDIQFARNEKAKQKRALIDRITANVADPQDREAHARRLASRSLAELQADASLVPEQKPVEERWPNYLGAAAPVGNAGEDTDDVLALPRTFN